MSDNEIPGFAEMNANFDRLTYGLRRKYLMKAVTAGAQPVIAEAARLAPRLQEPDKRRVAGALADKMTSRIYDSSAAEVTARIGPDKKTFYGRYPESGTTTQRARPFLRPALDAKRAEAYRIIGEELMAGIESELRK